MNRPIITIRASSLGELFDCPARWAAKHIEGRFLPSSGAAQLGTAVHAGTALFDASRLPGESPVTVDDAAGVVVDAIHKPEFEVDWAEDKPQDAERIALALHTKYCKEVAPTQDYAAVEIACEKLEISDLGIALTGTTDRVRRTDDGFGISDIKTGKTAVSADGTVKTAGHAFQMGVYELLAEFASGLPITCPAQIIGLNTGKTAAAQRAGLGEIEGTREVLLGDGDTPGVLENASRLIHSGAFYGNPRSMLCNPKYCPNFQTCKFRK
ncbi:MAG TPA: PD-(D/E)XK nuclease family protein [Burkholderiaceae bacterium]|nr:PD-(D/E)XK nuclease family protein [Burkholderiaceae bacterium]